MVGVAVAAVLALLCPAADGQVVPAAVPPPSNLPPAINQLLGDPLGAIPPLAVPPGAGPDLGKKLVKVVEDEVGSNPLDAVALPPAAGPANGLQTPSLEKVEAMVAGLAAPGPGPGAGNGPVKNGGPPGAFVKQTPGGLPAGLAKFLGVVAGPPAGGAGGMSAAAPASRASTNLATPASSHPVSVAGATRHGAATAAPAVGASVDRQRLASATTPATPARPLGTPAAHPVAASGPAPPSQPLAPAAKVLAPPPGPPGPLDATPSLLVGGFALLGILARIIFGLPLVNRMRRAQLLKHETRLAMLALVRARPGIHFNEIARELGLARGLAAHHLHAMEAAGLVTKSGVRAYSCYFADPEDAALEDAARALKAAKARRVFSTVLRHPGVSVAQACERADVSRRMFTYHASRLMDAGLLLKERDGRDVRLYPSALAREIGFPKTGELRRSDRKRIATAPPT